MPLPLQDTSESRRTPMSMSRWAVRRVGICPGFNSLVTHRLSSAQGAPDRASLHQSWAHPVWHTWRYSRDKESNGRVANPVSDQCRPRMDQATQTRVRRAVLLVPGGLLLPTRARQLYCSRTAKSTAGVFATRQR